MQFVLSAPIVPRLPSMPDKRKALFLARKMLPEYVFDASKLENNPLTFPEVQTLMDGITVGGRKISDVQQVLNIRDAWNYILDLVAHHPRFQFDMDTFNAVHALIAREEALEWGTFRTGAVGIAGTTGYQCPPAENLHDIFTQESSMNLSSNPIETAIRVFLWSVLNQFYWDGNKRTARLMVSGFLMSCGIGVFNIKARDIQEFNSKMLDFYNTKNADEIAAFLNEKCIVTIE